MAVYPVGQMPLPAIVDRIVDRLTAGPDDGTIGWERAYRALRPLPDVDHLLLALAFGEDFRPGELGYRRHPFEVIPLFWNGGDGLHYGFAWYDAAIPPAGVSYAPVDDEAVWLGDTAEDGVRNLLAWYTHGDPTGDAEYDRRCRDAGMALATALGLDISELPPLTGGARSDAEIVPILPDGWRHIPGRDGIGTVAPAAAFGPELADHGWDSDAWLATGRQALDAGFPGTALTAFRAAYDTSVGEPVAAAAMREAYLALGRDPLAARVDAYLEEHPL